MKRLGFSLLLSLVSGDIFVFFSHDRKRIKLLRWDGDGFIITSKKREDVCTIAERIKGEINKQRINIRSEYSIEKINV